MRLHTLDVKRQNLKMTVNANLFRSNVKVWDQKAIKSNNKLMVKLSIGKKLIDRNRRTQN